VRQRWGTVRTGNYRFFFLWGKGKEIRPLGTDFFFVHHRIVSALEKVEFVSDGMSSVVLRGRWCNIIVLNVYAPSEDKIDDSEDSFVRNSSTLSIIFLSTI